MSRYRAKKTITINGVELTALMQDGETPIFEFTDLLRVPKFTRLTKWLSMTMDEMEYLRGEVARINSDPQRKSAIGYSLGKVALYVNDLTDGAFDGLRDTCD